jgi:hypothetical protein
LTSAKDVSFREFLGKGVKHVSHDYGASRRLP